MSPPNRHNHDSRRKTVSAPPTRSQAILLLLFLLIAFLPALTRRAAARHSHNALQDVPQVAPPPLTPHADPLDLDLQLFVPAGLIQSPTAIAHAGDARLFVVERTGRIRIVRPDGSVQGPAFLDITGRVRLESGTEQGLLGLVFDPQYTEPGAPGYGAFYVNYTAEPDGATRVSRFTVSDNPNLADRHSEQIIFTIDQPFATHNGGDLLFGPDGYLYIPLGDGGSHYDPGNRSQNLNVLYGKIVRLDVRPATPGALPPDCGTGLYTIPAANPFVAHPSACNEIWAYGLRNPWRASFDRLTGDLYIADVGEGQWEEINKQAASSAGGQNYGWRCYEGTQLISSDPACQDPSIFTRPVFQYGHSTGDGCAVTGGYVYRGYRYPRMAGRYFLSDFCSGYLWDIVEENAWTARRYTHLSDRIARAATFGQDMFGELYIARLNGGAIYRLTDALFINDVDPHLYLPLVLN